MIALTWLTTTATQPDKSAQLLGDVLPWLILLVGIIIAGGVAIYFLRRWMAHDATATAGFTLQDLRDIHARGELTDEQFHAAKTAMIGRLGETSKPRDVDTSKKNPHSGGISQSDA